MRNKIDWEDKLLLLIGFSVPYYWWLRAVRKELINGNINKKEALNMCGVRNE